MMHPAAWLVSRRLTDLAGPWNERISLNDDGEYFCRIVTASEKVKFCADARSYYRIGNFDSLSSRTSRKAMESLFLSVDLCRQHLFDLEDNENTRQACINLYQEVISEANPEETGIVNMARKGIIELGGSPEPPKESWKFSVLRKAIGWKRAKMLQLWFRRLEVLTHRNLEMLLSFLNLKIK